MKIKVRPAKDAQAAVYLGGKCWVKPSRDEAANAKWKTVTLPDKEPRFDKVDDSSKKAISDFRMIKGRIMYYYRRGLIEVSCDDPNNVFVKEVLSQKPEKIEFFCKGIHPKTKQICGGPIYRDGMCWNHWAESQPKDQKPFREYEPVERA